jgi:hypothetical protein
MKESQPLETIFTQLDYSQPLSFSNICHMGKSTKLGTLELLEFCFTLSKAQKIAQMKFEKYE